MPSYFTIRTLMDAPDLSEEQGQLTHAPSFPRDGCVPALLSRRDAFLQGCVEERAVDGELGSGIPGCCPPADSGVTESVPLSGSALCNGMDGHAWWLCPRLKPRVPVVPGSLLGPAGHISENHSCTRGGSNDSDLHPPSSSWTNKIFPGDTQTTPSLTP